METGWSDVSWTLLEGSHHCRLVCLLVSYDSDVMSE